MSQFPWQTSYMPSYSTGGDEQIEALQTDVMRFMAIIGLCLMAIFSIVQSLPYQAVEKTPQIEVDVLSMQNEIKLLDDTVKQKQQAEQQLEQTLVKKRGQLTVLKQRIQQEQEALSQLQKQQLKKTIDQLNEFVVEKTTTEQKTVKPVVEKKGFSLRFASDQTILGLLKQKQIGLYIMTGNKSWKLSSLSKGWRIIKAKKPKQYHQMSETTVPSVLRQVVRKQLSIQHRSQVIWAVALPKLITDSISQRVKNKQGGDLVIGGDGKVELNL